MEDDPNIDSKNNKVGPTLSHNKKIITPSKETIEELDAQKENPKTEIENNKEDVYDPKKYGNVDNYKPSKNTPLVTAEVSSRPISLQVPVVLVFSTFSFISGFSSLYTSVSSLNINDNLEKISITLSVAILLSAIYLLFSYDEDRVVLVFKGFRFFYTTYIFLDLLIGGNFILMIMHFLMVLFILFVIHKVKMRFARF